MSSQPIIIQSDFISSRAIADALSTIEGVSVTLEEKTVHDRSVFSDPIVVSAMVAGGVAVINKLIDALVEVYKLERDKADQPAPNQPVINLVLADDQEVRLKLNQLPDKKEERINILENVPELSESAVKRVEVLEEG